MRKVIVFFGLFILGITISSFSKEETTTAKNLFLTKTVSTVLPESESYTQTINIPFVGNSFNGFKEAVAFKESQGRYHIVNTLGYLGEISIWEINIKKI